MISQLITMLKNAGLALVVALVTGMITVFVMTKDIETAPFGALTSLYILPAILVFVILSATVPILIIRHLGYWVVTALICSYFGYLYMQSSGSVIDDGSSRMLILTIYAIVVGSIMAYLSLVLFKFTE
ncbi:MAG: hypothetical protein GY737_03820 [Desulfobacteraceae bacterium]|nr:hypothetical protein [Desulfobacteraceae bacterium]